MNKGTKIRTAIAIVMLINEALIRIGTVDFGNEISNQIYRWVSFAFLVAAYVASHWYNNDFTPEACEGTGYTRMLKSGDDGMDIVVDDYIEDGDENE